MNSLILGFGSILLAAVAGGAFGLQYRVMRRYRVENASLLSIFFATVPIPLIACQLLLPGWTDAIAQAGFKANAVVMAFGFCWGLGAITYAYSFNILGMALAASLLKGISIAIGAGLPLLWRWEHVPLEAKMVTIIGLVILILGTAIAGKAGIMREKETRENPQSDGAEVPSSKTVFEPTGKIFWIGLLMCLLSGAVSACANLGYDRAEAIEAAMVESSQGTPLAWKATLIRWMPMYWGGITALLVFMGGAMVINGSWKNYFAKDSLRDFAISSSMGGVHFLAQIPYGIGAFYLGQLGTTVGWGINLGMALIVAAALGLLTGEWKKTAKITLRTLIAGIVVSLIAMGILAYANSLV